MLSKFGVTLTVLCFLSGVSLAQPVEERGTSSKMPVIEKGIKTLSDEKNLKHYTFRVGKIRMTDNHNTPTINKEIRDVYLIRFLIPSRDITKEHPFYSFGKGWEGFGNWCKDHFDLHIGMTKQSNPSLYLIGGSFEISNFVDSVFGAAFSNDLNYRDPMYYWGITFDSSLFHHLIDMIQEGIKTAEK